MHWEKTRQSKTNRLDSYFPSGNIGLSKQPVPAKKEVVHPPAICTRHLPGPEFPGWKEKQKVQANASHDVAPVDSTHSKMSKAVPEPSLIPL